MSDPESKHVEAEVSEETYERLERIAESRDISVEDVVTEAIDEYAQLYDPDDPIFNIQPGGSDGEKLTAERTDEYLYGPLKSGER